MTGRPPGSAQHALKWDMGAVTDASYSPCGRLIVLACSNDRSGPDGAHRVLVWSAVSGRLCRWYDAHRGAVTARSWAPQCRATEGFSSAGGNAAAPRLEENALVTGCEDGAVRLWFVCASPQGEGKPAHERWGGGEETEEEEGGVRRRERRRGGRGTVVRRVGFSTRVVIEDAGRRRRAAAAAHSPGGGKIAIARGTGEVAVLAARTFDAELERRLPASARAARAPSRGPARTDGRASREGRGETRGRRNARTPTPTPTRTPRVGRRRGRVGRRLVRRLRRGPPRGRRRGRPVPTTPTTPTTPTREGEGGGMGRVGVSDSSDTSDVVSDVSDTSRSALPPLLQVLPFGGVALLLIHLRFCLASVGVRR